MAINVTNSSLNHNDDGINGDVVMVMIPFLPQGHLNPLLYLSGLISSSYNIPIYFLSYADKIKQAKLHAHCQDSNIHFKEFPNPPCRDHKSSSKTMAQHLKTIMEESFMLREPVGAFLQEAARKTRRVVVIYDSLMACVVQEHIVSIQNAEAYCFNPSSSFFICSTFWEAALKRLRHLPAFVKKFVGNFAEKLLLPNGFEFPNDLSSLETSFIPEFLDFVHMQFRNNNFCSGNLYSTCKAVEGPYLDVLAKFNWLLGRGKQWAIGPLHSVESKLDVGSNRHKCLKWLDQQEPNSVILVSFGTTTSLCSEQINELAVGLEKSQQKFIWVLSDALLREGEKTPIPLGYQESVQERGIVVNDWVPQSELLAHPATGGFLSHCGWNSCFESITMGVPIATWPMIFDHPRTALFMTEVLKIGITVKDWGRRDELITSTTIETAVRTLMASAEGNEMRMKVIKLAKNVRKSVMDGGNVPIEMDSFIAHIARS